MVCNAYVKLRIPEAKMVRLPPSGFHHVPHRIDSENSALGLDQGSYGLCGLSGTGSNIENCVSAANQPILDKGRRDRRKHLPDDFAVFLPERSGNTPSADDVLAGLHDQKYTFRAVHALTRTWAGARFTRGLRFTLADHKCELAVLQQVPYNQLLANVGR